MQARPQSSGQYLSFLMKHLQPEGCKLGLHAHPESRKSLEQLHGVIKSSPVQQTRETGQLGQSVSVQKHQSEIINGSESVEVHKGVHLQGVLILNNTFDDQHSCEGYPLFGSGFALYTQLESDQSAHVKQNKQSSLTLGSPFSRHLNADGNITLNSYPLLQEILPI
ncbi:MAG: hypothetical protein EZS28_021773 [Streblomastix strix]|uniref:Uncharacterized protein n=1 Tax=Streblomastix strix TaxID=222440 RepID=A0A5J4VJG6_9EUKA|nr:MAG: hypothetical protein EZS28_021773 [Streblomastix strix]